MTKRIHAKYLFDPLCGWCYGAAPMLERLGGQLEALRAIQAARYVDGRDITDFAVLGEILRALSLLEAAERLQKQDDALVVAGKSHIQKGQTAMRSFGVTGVPRLIAGIGETRRPVPGAALFGDAEALIALLKAA